jgi:hypothetical protein
MNDVINFSPAKLQRCGRPRGTISKKSLAAMAKSAKTGATPLDVLLRFARGRPLRHCTKDGWATHYPSPQQMLAAAVAAAPYLHPRLSAVVVETRPEMTHEEWLKRLPPLPEFEPEQAEVGA